MYMSICGKMENIREMKGRQIADLEGGIRRVNEQLYKVKSQSGNGEYKVTNTALGWKCSCPDHKYRGVKCKHIFGVEFSLALREEVQTGVVIQPISSLVCQFCGSEMVVKKAKRHNKYGDLQRFFCKACGRRFSINLGFEKMKASPQIITSAMQLYFTGESLRNVQKFLALQGVKVSHVSVYKWIRKYIGMMEKYLEQIKPRVSGTWRADELWVKIKGDMKYLFALIDDETRFWIAQEVADSKHKHDAKSFFMKGKELAGKRPQVLITDGLPVYRDAFNKVFYANTGPQSRHISTVRWRGNMENNKMERFNGEVRDREKTIRGLKKNDTPILTGYQIFHNYIRPHEALNGRTPAEACGIKVEGQNKWITIIENASRDPTVNARGDNPQS
jgi:putative transposase